MRVSHTAALTCLIMALAGCEDAALPPATPACSINAPPELLPREVKQIRLGMSLGALRRLLGKPDYTPVAGQFYFLTGGLCPTSSAGGTQFACGVVAEFRRFEYGVAPDDVVTDSLQSCRWGAIND